MCGAVNIFVTFIILYVILWTAPACVHWGKCIGNMKETISQLHRHV